MTIFGTIFARDRNEVAGKAEMPQEVAKYAGGCVAKL